MVAGRRQPWGSAGTPWLGHHRQMKGKTMTMKTMTLFNGDTIEYRSPAGGFGWTSGHKKLGEGVNVSRVYQLYVREHDGEVFVVEDGLVHAATGEKTVQFNNRIWTLSEEKAQMERILGEDTN